mmetsp:Transcript_27879/g.41146  ORF Transcript_27879/g.41146 Transcript_27879/m.41146 type:complete len:511 (+) Transcript_27879:95-1627(+)
MIILWLYLLLPNFAASFTSCSRSQLPEVTWSSLFAKGESDRRFVITTATSTLVAAVSSATLQAPAYATTSSAIPTPAFTKDLSWPLGKVAFSLLPLAGTSTRRATVEQEVVAGKIWTFDQLQGVVNVNVPVRQTVVKLSEAASGGLWIHNPVAPTPQLLKMMRRLEEQNGPIRHIVLGTVALEHKATFGAFARNFPNATVWIQPGQWSFPVNLPIQEFLPQRGPKLREIPVEGKRAGSAALQYYAEKNPVPEWSADFDWEVLGPLKFESVGTFSETAFFHKSTKSLIVTDTVISVTENPPAIIEEDPRGMLFHSRNSIKDVVEDTPEARRRGWRRMVQFGLCFFPSKIGVNSVGQALSEAKSIDPSMRTLGADAVPGSLYPWTWPDDSDIKNFKAISQGGKLFCPPILTKLILDREPRRTIAWVDSICKRFDFQRVIPSHLNNDVKAGPKEFSEAFDMLRSTPEKIYPQRPLPEDLALLQKASDLLTNLRVVAPSQVCDGEPARQKGRSA